MKTFKNIRRSNDRTKFLSLKAQILAQNYFNILKKSAKDYIVVKNEFISKIASTTIYQNRRLHAQLKDIFVITYYQKFKTYCFCFKITLTEKAEEILSDPAAFYDVDNPVDNPVDNSRDVKHKCLTLPSISYVDNPVDNSVDNLINAQPCYAFMLNPAKHFMPAIPDLSRDVEDVSPPLIYFKEYNTILDDYIENEIKTDIFNKSFKEFSEKNILYKDIVSSQEFLEFCSEIEQKALKDLCDFEFDSDKKIAVITPRNFTFTADLKNRLKKIIQQKFSEDVEIVQRYAKNDDKLLHLQEFLVKEIGEQRFKAWFSNLQVSQRSTHKKLILYANQFVVDTIIARFSSDVLRFAIESKVEIIFYSLLQNNFTHVIIKNYRNDFQNDDTNNTANAG